MKKIFFCNVATPLIFGGLIYIFLRSQSLRMFNWLDLIGIKTSILNYRSFFYPLKNHLPLWFYFSLPDGLWIYSFSSALLIYWNNDFKKVKYWLLIPFTSGILIEILQGFKFFRGTFDFLDLLFSALGLFLSKTIMNYKFKQL
jgi:hypothetical protein